ncbi:hypothetical protein [Brevundimonas sp.]|uniref:hypothetical protein n=1 Tax=Brevundimonas sp. TaxID=1871086 RepID=UPI0025F01B63|nr:hypothetical protein [Brevundimonas sp.]
MRYLLLMVLVVGAVGCREPAPPIEGTEEPVWVEPDLIARSAVRPFPDATEVRLLVEGEITQDDLNPGFIEPEGRVLSADQRRAFERTLSAASYGEGDRAYSACFIPHHFFRYFDAQGRQVGQVAVCFCCYGVQAWPDLDLPVAPGADFVEFQFDEPALRALISSMELPVDINCGD